MIRMVFLLLLLMQGGVVSSGTFADIFPCSNNSLGDGPLYFAENTQFAVCCKIREKLCNATSDNVTLTLLPENEKASQMMYRIDDCLVMFEFINASSEDEKYYECKHNSSLVAIGKVYIIKKPTPPVIISFSCTPNKALTVVFDRGPPTTNYTELYLVTMIDPKRTVILCNNTSSMCKLNDQICTCTYWDSSDIIPMPHYEVIITVRVSRPVQFSETRKNYFIAASILPGPIKRLQIKEMSPYDVNVTFCMHKDIMGLHGFMHTAGASLQFHLWLFSIQGVPEILQVTFPSIEGDCSYCEVIRCMQVHFSNLTPFTNYTLVVSNSGGGGESKKRKLEFTTDQTEPAQPPEVDEFSFIRWDSVTVSGNLTSGLILMWKPLPHAAVGGRDLSYHIEVTSNSGFSVNQTILETYAILNMDLPPDPLTAKIWSQNAIGQSKYFTQLNIAPKSVKRMPYIAVELNEVRALVYVNLTDLTSDMPLTIQWCSNYIKNKNLYVCQEYPQTSNTTILAGDLTAKNVEISISPCKPDDETKEVIRTIEYYHLEYLNREPEDKLVANATVTTNPHNIQAIEDYDYYTDSDADDSDDYYYDLYRRKRDVGNIVMLSEVQRRNLLQISQTGDDSLQTVPKVFISLKMEDSNWNSGMIPASCYYDRKKDKVNLIVSSDTDDTETVILQWIQACDGDTPQQFLADYFRVFPSNDETCKEDGAPIDTIKNRIVRPNIMKLTKRIKFACIQACKIDGVCQFAPAYSVQYPAGTESQTKKVLLIVLPIVFGVLGVLGLLSLVCVWRNRNKRNKRKLLPCSILKLPCQPVLEPQRDAEKGNASPDLPGMTRSDHVTLSSNSTDSGRGSDLCDSGCFKNLKNASNKESDITPETVNAITFKNPLHESRSLNDASNTHDASNTQDNGSGMSMQNGEKADDNEENDGCDDTDDESQDDPEDSDSDMDQNRELQKVGLSFNNKNVSRSSQSYDCSEAFSSTNESDGATSCSHLDDSLGRSTVSKEDDVPPSPDVESILNNHFQNHVIQRMSSESESDADSERALISKKTVH